MRAALNLEATLVDTINPGSEWIEVGGTRKHVMSYLTDFLFSPERANSPVRTLSGGERNRVLLARLFALPANVLVLDRRFLDNVVTSTIAWEGDPTFAGKPGLWREYEGGFEDWKQQRERSRVQAGSAGPRPAATEAAPRSSSKAKLSYKEQRELDALPGQIEALEAEQKLIADTLAGSEIYVKEPTRVGALQTRHDSIEEELLAALERWETLGSR